MHIIFGAHCEGEVFFFFSLFCLYLHLESFLLFLITSSSTFDLLRSFWPLITSLYIPNCRFTLIFASTMSTSLWMPVFGECITLTFDPAHPNELLHFFARLKTLFDCCNVQNDLQKKTYVTSYVDYELAEYWEALPEFRNSSKTYIDLRDRLLDFYHQQSFKYTVSDLDHIVALYPPLLLSHVIINSSYFSFCVVLYTISSDVALSALLLRYVLASSPGCVALFFSCTTYLYLWLLFRSCCLLFATMYLHCIVLFLYCVPISPCGLFTV